MKINLNPKMNSKIADIMRVSEQPAQMYGAALIDAYRASGLEPDEIPRLKAKLDTLRGVEVSEKRKNATLKRALETMLNKSMGMWCSHTCNNKKDCFNCLIQQAQEQEAHHAE